jgi:hypothetical protein
VVAVNCDPSRSPATHSTRFPSCSVFIPRTRTISILSRLGWLSPIIIYSRVLYCYYHRNLVGYVTFNTASYLEDTDIVLKAGDYVILTKSGIATIPTSNITGNVGVSPITAAAMTGFGLVLDGSGQFATASQLSEGSEAHGASYAGAVAAALTVAILDTQATYTEAAGRTEGREGETEKINLHGGILGAVLGSSENPLTPGIYTYVHHRRHHQR